MRSVGSAALLGDERRIGAGRVGQTRRAYVVRADVYYARAQYEIKVELEVSGGV